MNITSPSPYFPSIEDIKAAYGGTVTRLGNKVLWSPNNRATFRIEPTCMGFTLSPFFTRQDADPSPWEKPEREATWWKRANWLYKNCVIAEEFGVHRSTVAQRRRRLFPVS
jgi:hypothetical protein